MRIVTKKEDQRTDEMLTTLKAQHEELVVSLRDEITYLRGELQQAIQRQQLGTAELLNVYRPKEQPVFEKPKFSMPNIESDWQASVRARVAEIEKEQTSEPPQAAAQG